MKKTKKKPKNMVEWFMKHNISGNICSLDLAITRAIEYLSKTEIYE